MLFRSSALYFLGVMLIGVSVLSNVLNLIRTFLFTDTTNRIDVTLGSSIISHLLRLPLSYFGKRSVGEVSGRVGELEKIRSFLTGTALSVFLDSIFSIIYIAVLLSYSVQLTIWALGVLPIFIALTIFSMAIEGCFSLSHECFVSHHEHPTSQPANLIKKALLPA